LGNGNTNSQSEFAVHIGACKTMFCPRCSKKLRLEKAYTLTRWHYEIYACDNCKISWDLFINSPKGILKIEECPYYEPPE